MVLTMIMTFVSLESLPLRLVKTLNVQCGHFTILRLLQGSVTSAVYLIN